MQTPPSTGDGLAAAAAAAGSVAGAAAATGAVPTVSAAVGAPNSPHLSSAAHDGDQTVATAAVAAATASVEPEHSLARPRPSSSSSRKKKKSSAAHWSGGESEDDEYVERSSRGMLAASPSDRPIATRAKRQRDEAAAAAAGARAGAGAAAQMLAAPLIGQHSNRELRQLHADARRLAAASAPSQTNSDNNQELKQLLGAWKARDAFKPFICGRLRIDVFRPRTGDAQSPLQEPALQLLQLHFQDLSEDDLVAPQRFCVVLRQLGDGDDGRVDSGAKKDGSAAAVAASLLHVCVCTVLPSQPVIDAHVTTHHTLVIQWCATKEEMQQRGYAQLVLVGQLNWMAALLFNSDCARNSVFVHARPREMRRDDIDEQSSGSEEEQKNDKHCPFRDKFEFQHNRTATQLSGDMWRSGAVLCSRPVAVEVDKKGLPLAAVAAWPAPVAGFERLQLATEANASTWAAKLHADKGRLSENGSDSSSSSSSTGSSAAAAADIPPPFRMRKAERVIAAAERSWERSLVFRASSSKSEELAESPLQSSLRRSLALLVPPPQPAAARAAIAASAMPAARHVGHAASAAVVAPPLLPPMPSLSPKAAAEHQSPAPLRLSQSTLLPVAAAPLSAVNAHSAKVEPVLPPPPAVAGAAAAEGDAVTRTNSSEPKGDSASAVHASLSPQLDQGAAGPDASNSSHASEARSAGIAPPAAPDVDLDMPQGFAAARSDDDSDSMDDSLQPGSESPADAAPVEHDGADSTDGELPPGVDMELDTLDEEIAEVKVERPEPVVIDLTADDEEEAEQQQQQQEGEEPSAKRARTDSQAADADADGDAAAAAPSTSAVKVESGSGSGAVKEESRGAAASATATTAAPAFHRTHSEFWRRLGLTPAQLQAVKAELPDGADPTKFDLLCNFGAVVLGACGLKRVQIATWADLISRTPRNW